MHEWSAWLAALAIGAPFATTLGLGFWAFLVRVPGERTAHRIAVAALLTSAASLVGLSVITVQSAQPYLEVGYGPWFRVGHYVFELALLLDELSLGFALTIVTVALLIARFAIRYLHREPGHPRFFAFLCLAVAGLETIALAASYDVLFLGWEVVGAASFAMVLFYHTRPGPARAAMQVFVSYRLADLGILIGAVILHHAAGTTRYEAIFEHGAWPDGRIRIDSTVAAVVGALLLLTAAGKSAQLPFSAWLPRAMEGPTPSSALFYGALSIHAGVFLLLRSAPLFEHQPIARMLLLLVGGGTAVYAALTGRVRSDAKGQLAFATMAQVGVMLVEIGLGWVLLAALHLVAHAFLRGFQLLRTPSVIADVRHIRAKLRGRPFAQENALERALPIPVARWLYRHALERFHLELLAQRFVITPVLRVSQWLSTADAAIVDALSGDTSEDSAALGPSLRPSHRPSAQPDQPAIGDQEGRA